MGLGFWLGSSPADAATPSTALYPRITDETKKTIVVATVGVVALAAFFWFMTRNKY